MGHHLHDEQLSRSFEKNNRRNRFLAAERSYRDPMLRQRSPSDVSIWPESRVLVTIVRLTHKLNCGTDIVTSEKVVSPALRFNHCARFFRRILRHIFADLLPSSRKYVLDSGWTIKSHSPFDFSELGKNPD